MRDLIVSDSGHGLFLVFRRITIDVRLGRWLQRRRDFALCLYSVNIYSFLIGSVISYL